MKRLKLVGLLCVLAACSDSSVERHVALAVQPGAFPYATTAVLGERLRVDVGGLEPLLQNRSLAAWASVNGLWIRLGRITPGTPSTFASGPMGWTWGDATLVELVEEPITETPDAPPGPPLFKGRPGESLALGSAVRIDATAFASATAEVMAVDNSAVLSHSGLPLAGAGIHYAAWLLPKGVVLPTAAVDTGDGHGGHAHGALESTQPVLLGKLTTAASQTFTTERMVAEYVEVVITLELDNGSTGAALSTMVMRGAVPREVEGEEASAAHEH